MIIPIQTGFTDLVQLQGAIAMMLMDDPRIANAPVIPEIKLIMQSDLEVDMLWQINRNAFVITPNGVWDILPDNPGGLVGAGMLVEMPEMTVSSPGVTGSPATWNINVVTFEERNTNLTPGTGTMITAEQYSQLAIDILQLQYFGPYFNTLQVKQQAIVVAHDWMETKGVIAYRTQFTSTAGRQQTMRSPLPAIVINAGMVTITCSDHAAALYYTTDGTMPVSANYNQNATYPNPPGVGATPYTVPFAVTSGQLVYAAARSTNLILSPVAYATAP